MVACARRLGLWVVLAFALNFAWEMAQMPLYATRVTTERCLTAAGGDVAVTAIALALAAAVARGRRWLLWAALILLLVGAAAAIERLALSAGRWSYAAMPTLVGIGLAPLAQLPLIAVASNWLAGRPWWQERPNDAGLQERPYDDAGAPRAATGPGLSNRAKRPRTPDSG